MTATASTPADLSLFKERAQALRLMGLLAHWDAVQGDPARIAWTAELLAWEEAERARRSLERRLRSAHIGRFKPLADFDWDWPKQCDRAAVQELMTLAFMTDVSVWPWHLELSRKPAEHRVHGEYGGRGVHSSDGIYCSMPERRRHDRVHAQAGAGRLDASRQRDPIGVSQHAATCAAAVPRSGCSTA